MPCDRSWATMKCKRWWCPRVTTLYRLGWIESASDWKQKRGGKTWNSAKCQGNSRSAYMCRVCCILSCIVKTYLHTYTDFINRTPPFRIWVDSIKIYHTAFFTCTYFLYKHTCVWKDGYIQDIFCYFSAPGFLKYRGRWYEWCMEKVMRAPTATVEMSFSYFISI